MTDTPRSNRHVFFATCAPGVEPLLLAEAREHRLSKVEGQVGGVYFEGDTSAMWTSNLCFRTAVRILWRLRRFEARSEQVLYEEVRAIPWEDYISPTGSLVVNAQAKDSALDHTLFIAQKTKDAIVDRIRDLSGSRPNVDKEDPDLPIHVHVSHDRVTVSIDTTGASLHKRGWRAFQGRAPLAENLAAAVTLFSGWDKRAPLIDPFAGSATILIEAALLAAGMPPGYRRGFAFERFPRHDLRLWKKWRADRIPDLKLPPKLKLIGIENDPERLEGARENLRSVGLIDHVELVEGDALRYAWRSGWNAWIVSNPPYGERVGDRKKLARLYKELGACLRQKCEGYHVSLLCGAPELLDSLELPNAARIALTNGGIPCELLTTRV